MTVNASLRPLSQDAQTVLRMRAEAGRPHMDQLTPGQAREQVASASAVAGFPRALIGDVRDIQIDGPGGPLGLRCYRPPVTSSSLGPALLFFHGGGWVTGSLDTHDDICRRLCLELGFPVIAVDYRLAPEHPFPAAVHDAFAAARWLFERASSLGIDATQVAVGGDSAGGNLAAVLAIAAARGELPAFSYQTLFYPITDVGAESPSYARVADGVPISARTMRWLRNAYLADADGLDWRASPLRAPTLAETAPAFVITAQHDPMADEGKMYVQRLVEAGVEVVHLHYSHQLHAFISMGGLMRDAAGALSSAAAAMRAHFSQLASVE